MNRVGQERGRFQKAVLVYRTMDRSSYNAYGLMGKTCVVPRIVVRAIQRESVAKDTS